MCACHIRAERCPSCPLPVELRFPGSDQSRRPGHAASGAAIGVATPDAKALLQANDNLAVCRARFHQAMGLADLLEAEGQRRLGMVSSVLNPLDDGLHGNL